MLGERHSNGAPVFYDDRGNSDYAVIQDFDVHNHNYAGDIADRIQLLGRANSYSLQNGSWDGINGVGIFYSNDLIGIVQGMVAAQLNLSDNK